MNLRQLRYFCEVVEAGNARAAAHKLFVAPTAISMQMAQLEEAFGGALFDRTSRPMALTPLGQFVYPKAKELLSAAGRLTDEAKGIATGNLGWLSIGFTRSVIFSVLPAAVRAMKAAFPNVRIDLVEVLTEHQADGLRNGSIHLGIARAIGPVTAEPDLACTELFDDPLVAAIPMEHPLAARGGIAAADLDAMPFISYPQGPASQFSKRALGLLEAAGASPQVGYEAKEIHTALALVAAGLGATVVGRSVARNNRTDVCFLPITDLATGTKVFALRKGGKPHLVADAFLDILRQQCSAAGA
ncbi:MAG: LysR family transcriptional regulator [Ramlibacter sp.]